MISLDGKRAFVTGGTAGIGLAVAEAFVAAGAQVTIAGRRESGKEIADRVGARFLTMNVADEESVRQALGAVAADGALDVLVLNAGVAQPVTGLEGIASDAVRSVIDTNLLGTTWCLKHAAPHLADGGSVIVTSSVAAQLGMATEAVYAAAKAGATALVRSAALEFGPRGIRVNAVQPGAVATRMNPMPEALFGVLTPLGRKGTVHDLTGLYCFLAGDSSRYLTGQAITVDGGLSVGVTQATLRAVGDCVRQRTACAEGGQGKQVSA